MREGFRDELHKMRSETIAIARVVREHTQWAVDALVRGDHELAAKVIDGDDEIDLRTMETEEAIIQLTAMQSPVAQDLRLLWSLTHVLAHLERMGDLGVNIAKIARRSGERRAPQTLYDLLQAQGNLVYRVLEAAMQALEKSDAELAARLPELDEPIDHLHKQFFREIARLSEEEDAELGSMLVMASRHLERIADNAVDIGERILFLITGEMKFHRHADPN